VESWYGSIETDPWLAGTVPGDPARYVVNPERSHVEVAHASGRPCAPGERGRILVTDLHNRCFPLVRYDIGDLAVAAHRDHDGLPTLERIEGRAADVVVTASGTQLTEAIVSLAVLKAGAAGDHIDAYQCAQTGPDELELRITWRGRPEPTIEADLVAAFAAVLGEGTTVRVRPVDAIETLPSGKRWILRGLPSSSF